MEFVPCLNVWRKCEVGKVNHNADWKMVVLLVIWSNWVILVENFNDCSNGPIVQSYTWKDITVVQGSLCFNVQVIVALVTF